MILAARYRVRSEPSAGAAPDNPRFLSYGDGMRVVAVVAVIALHASGIGVMRYRELAPFQWWSFNIVDSLCRWAVPVFIMLSGALILDPARHELARAFYHRRVARIGVPLLAWASFYFCWTWGFYGEPVDLTFILRSLLDGLTYNHLYFLFLVLGLSAIAPVLRIYVTRVRRANQWVVAVVMLALLSCGIPQDVIPMNAFTRFVPFLGYFLVGILLRELPATRPLLAAALLAFAAASAIIAIGTGQRFANWGPDDWRSLGLYDTLGAAVVVQSIGMFVLLRACFAERAAAARHASRSLRCLAPLVFGIYLTHRAINDVLASVMHPLLAKAVLATVVLQIALTFVLSATVVAVIRRLPYLRHVVG